MYPLTRNSRASVKAEMEEKESEGIVIKKEAKNADVKETTNMVDGKVAGKSGIKAVKKGNVKAIKGTGLKTAGKSSVKAARMCGIKATDMKAEEMTGMKMLLNPSIESSRRPGVMLQKASKKVLKKAGVAMKKTGMKTTKKTGMKTTNKTGMKTTNKTGMKTTNKTGGVRDTKMTIMKRGKAARVKKEVKNQMGEVGCSGNSGSRFEPLEDGSAVLSQQMVVNLELADIIQPRDDVFIPEVDVTEDAVDIFLNITLPKHVINKDFAVQIEAVDTPVFQDFNDPTATSPFLQWAEVTYVRKSSES